MTATGGGVGAVVLGVVAVLAAWSLVGAVSPARPSPDLWRGERLVALGIAAGAVALVGWAAPIAVFLVVVALNLTLGRAESPPFSDYPMFSRPARQRLALTVVDADGEIVPVADRFGVSLVAVNKRFAADARAVLDGRRTPAELGTGIGRYLSDNGRHASIPPGLEVAVTTLAIERTRTTRTTSERCPIPPG